MPVTLYQQNRVNSGWEHGRPTTVWEQWLTEHTAKFLLFARQQTRCEPDAQDVVQDAVVEAWGRQEAGGPPPVALVFATIRRRAIDLGRSQTRRANREAAVENETAWFDSGVEERERAAVIKQAMQDLPEIYRDVITLKVWGRLTFAEIAEALHIPANTAASRYRYGLSELRQQTREVFV
jgi:RNA polymerase sigma-70 factor (ECF subfamily)